MARRTPPARSVVATSATVALAGRRRLTAAGVGVGAAVDAGVRTAAALALGRAAAGPVSGVTAGWPIPSERHEATNGPSAAAPPDAANPNKNRRRSTVGSRLRTQDAADGAVLASRVP